MVADGYARRTVTARLGLVRQVSQQAGVSPDELQRQHVINFLAGRDYATWSRRTYLQHLNAWAVWIGRPEITAGLRRPPVPPSHPDPIAEVDLQRLMSHLRERPREYAWVVLGAYAGLRAHEVARLHRSQLGHGVLRVHGKGGRIDALPMSPVLLEALRPYDLVDGAFWPVLPKTVSSVVREHAGAIGIRMRFHQLRHRFGTAVYRQSRDLLLTQRLMRHASPKTTAGYAAVADDAARHAVGQLPGAMPDPIPKE